MDEHENYFRNVWYTELLMEQAVTENDRSNGWLSTVKAFLKKYFWEGQHLDKEHEEKLENIPEGLSPENKFFLRNRKLIGFLIPMTFFTLIWWSLAIKYNLFQLFPDRYYISITMVFGALVAGSSARQLERSFDLPKCVTLIADGFAKVVISSNHCFYQCRFVSRLRMNSHKQKMTEKLRKQRNYKHAHHGHARQQKMLNVIGMTAAAFTIFWMKISLEWHSIVCCSFGAVFGFVFGVEAIDNRLTPPQKKMGFVSVWFSFAIALFILNMEKKRKTFDVIQHFNWWKAGVLGLTGFVGGMFTAVSGSGVDVCSFSVITLLFHVSEKVATPTSIVLMAINTVVGFYWRQMMMGTVSVESWEYLAVCVPIVVICAPFGSLLASHFHRLVLAGLIYVLEIVSLATGFAIVKPDWPLAVVSCIVIFGGFVFFFILSKVGKQMAQNEANAINAAERELKAIGLQIEPNGIVVNNASVGITNDQMQCGGTMLKAGASLN